MPTAVDCQMTSSTSAAKSAEALQSRREAAKEIIQTLARQLPPHDFDDRHCSSLRGDVERVTMTEFVEFRIKTALGQGSVLRSKDGESRCYECTRSILPGQLTVTAARAADESRWHVECFVCSCCRERLVQQVYFYSSKDGQVYCGRHHAELLRPRCAACDEIIFADQCTEADGRSWHVDHFRCTECRLPLAGKSYVFAGDEHDLSQPFCFGCYHAVHANFCRTCGKIVKAGQCHVTLSGTGSWHADGDCFRCDGCRQSLVGRPFILRERSSTCGSSTSDVVPGDELFCTEECCDRQAGFDLIAGELFTGDDGLNRAQSSTSFAEEAPTLRRKCASDDDETIGELVRQVESPCATERCRSDAKRQRSESRSKQTTQMNFIHAVTSGSLQSTEFMRCSDDVINPVGEALTRTWSNSEYSDDEGIECLSSEAATNTACKVTCV